MVGQIRGNDTITAVAGIRVGHWTDEEALTGCSVVLCDGGAVAAVDVRGGGPGTRETDALAPDRLVEKIDAVLLTGGSAFGLAAADGVMRFLEEQGRGYDTGFARVPIVPAAVIYDLGIGSAAVRPTADSGYEAARAATDEPVAEGNVGSGTGATAGKWAGPSFAMKSGLGSSAISLPGGGIVGALVAANPVGDIVRAGAGEIVAGAYNREAGRFVGEMLAQARGKDGADPAEDGRGDDSARGTDSTPGSPSGSPSLNTIVAVVATDIPLSRAALQRVAAMAHDGMARAVYPAHTPFDGDTVFALSTGLALGWEPSKHWAEEMERAGRIGAAAAEALSAAIVRAALAAGSAGGLPAYGDLPTSR